MRSSGQEKYPDQSSTTQACRDHDRTLSILLVEPMFVLVCLVSLPGAPRRAFDARVRWLALLHCFVMVRDGAAVLKCKGNTNSGVERTSSTKEGVSHYLEGSKHERLVPQEAEHE